jgi:hypothetical protein
MMILSLHWGHDEQSTAETRLVCCLLAPQEKADRPSPIQQCFKNRRSSLDSLRFGCDMALDFGLILLIAPRFSPNSK